MNAISLLANMCISIELWHLVYWNFLYEKYFKRPETIMKWAESYKKFNQYFMEFADYYAKNLDLQYALGLHFNQPLFSIIDILQQIGGERTGLHKILNICPIKYLILFLLHQVTDIVYWILLVALAIIMPAKTGLILLGIIWLLGKLQMYLNKNRRILWINLSSLLCIYIFVLVTLF